MLHVGVLPHHDRWGDVLHNLRVVVVDEAHVYRGVFGSHVGERPPAAAAARARVRRGAASSCSRRRRSRTPASSRRDSPGLDVRVDRRATRPRAPNARSSLWNPELLDAELGIRASPLGDASRLLAELVDRGLRTICFTKSRKAAELVHRFASDRLDAATARRLAPYRAGYTPGAAARDRAPARRGRAARRDRDRRARARHRHRRARLRHLGRLPGHGRVAAAAVGTRRTADTRARRADRERGRARPVLRRRARARSSSARVEAALIDHATPRILDGHVLVGGVRGAARRPRTPRSSGPRRSSARPSSPSSRRRRRATSGADGTPRPRGSRSARATPRRSSIVDEDTGTRARHRRARARVLDGSRRRRLPPSRRAVRRHRARPRGADGARPARRPWTGTRRPRKETETTIVEALQSRAVAGVELHLGRIDVSEQVVAFQRKAVADGSVIDTTPLDLPGDVVRDRGRVVLARALASRRASTRCRRSSRPSTPPSTRSSRSCRSSRCATAGTSAGSRRTSTSRRARPTIFVYEGHAGGVGIAERGFDCFAEWVADTARLLARCPCRARLPFLRPEPEVREPQRAARQGRGADAARAHVRMSRSVARDGSTAHSRPAGPARRRHSDVTGPRSVSCDRSGRGPRSPLGVPWTRAELAPRTSARLVGAVAHVRRQAVDSGEPRSSSIRETETERTRRRERWSTWH